MSFAKRELENQEARLRSATIVSVRAEDLRECATCGEVTDNMTGDPEASIALMEELVAAHDDVVAIFEGDLELATKAIHDAIANTGEECGCDRALSANG